MLRAALKGLVAIIILAAGIGVFKLFVATKAVTEPEPASERSWNVSSVLLQQTNTRPSILSFGTVQSSNMIDIRPSLTGRVEEVGPNFVEGGMIAQGDLMVTLDRFDMEQNVADLKAKSKETDAQIKETRAELEGERNQISALEEEASLVERDYERTLSLSKRGTTSTATIERAEIELNRIRRSVLQKQQIVARLEASVDRLQAISEQRKVALERAYRDLDDTIINSPSTGFLTDVRAGKGLEVGPNDRLATLHPIDKMEIRFELSEADLGVILGYGSRRALPIGETLEVMWRVGGQEFRFNAVLDRVEGKFDASSASVGLYAKIDAASIKNLPAPLRPGAFVEVLMPGPDLKNVFELPQAALGMDESIFIINDQNRAEERKVSYLFGQNGQVFVIGDLKNGDKVITSRFPELGPGALVRSQ